MANDVAVVGSSRSRREEWMRRLYGVLLLQHHPWVINAIGFVICSSCSCKVALAAMITTPGHNGSSRSCCTK